MGDDDTQYAGMLGIQSQYLTDLAAYINKDTTYATNGASEISDLETRLNALHTTYEISNIKSQNIIDNQLKMAEIVDEETQRLANKKRQVDDKMHEARRMVYFNENYRKRQNAINNILFVITITLILFIIIFILKSRFPIIPEYIYYILIVILISVSVIIITRMLIKLYYSRDEFDYDKIKGPPPPSINKNVNTNTNTQNNLTNDLFNLNFNQCIGSSCCTKPSIWDPDSGKCILPNSDSASPNTLLDFTSSDSATTTYISPANCINTKKRCGQTCINSTENCGKNEGFEVMPAYSLYKSIYN
jgi:hypothetical protein